MKPKPKPEGLHWAMSVRFPAEPWRNRELCVWTWQQLQKLFPKIYAAVLMPDHLHIITPPLTPAEIAWLLEALRRLQIRISRRAGISLTWQETSEPRPIPNLTHLATQVRYVHLNPCRKGYCKDPLEWEFSTHREYLGAVHRPWAQRELVLTRLAYGSNEPGRTEFHRYVSGDPSVHPAGTPAPIRHSTQVGVVDLRNVERAFCLALRIPFRRTREKGAMRRLFMQVLVSPPFSMRASDIAQHLDVHPTTVGEVKPIGPELAGAVLAVMADRRLLAALGTLEK